MQQRNVASNPMSPLSLNETEEETKEVQDAESAAFYLAHDGRPSPDDWFEESFNDLN